MGPGCVKTLACIPGLLESCSGQLRGFLMKRFIEGVDRRQTTL
ncbi:MAG: hypothetical protein ACI9JL_003814, partial [Paracoccaceae bacterium]